MKFNLLISFSLLVISGILLSCEDHRITSPSGQHFRLKRTNFEGLRSKSETLYNYGSNNRLINYAYRSGTSSFIFVNTISYDEQGRVLKAEGPVTNTYNSRIDYGYDSKGNITSVKQYNDQKISGTYELRDAYELTYGDTKFPIKSFRRTSEGFERTELYTYSDGNVVRVDATDNNSTPTSVTFTYTDKPNPYYGFTAGRLPNLDIYSKNVAVLSNYTNTYNSDGLLIKQVQTNVGAVDNTYSYQYEAY